MNRIMSVLMLSIIFIILGCSSTSEPFVFSGESDHWQAKLTVTQTTDNNEKQHFTLQYKGEDVEAIEGLSYTVETNAGGFSAGGVTLEENGTYKETNEGNTANAKVNKDSEVNVLVEWNNHTENLVLKSE